MQYQKKLLKYLKENNIRHHDFATRLNIHYAHMSRLLNGKCPFTDNLKTLIEFFTDGNVTKDS